MINIDAFEAFECKNCGDCSNFVSAQEFNPEISKDTCICGCKKLAHRCKEITNREVREESNSRRNGLDSRINQVNKLYAKYPDKRGDDDDDDHHQGPYSLVRNSTDSTRVRNSTDSTRFYAHKEPKDSKRSTTTTPKKVGKQPLNFNDSPPNDEPRTLLCGGGSSRSSSSSSSSSSSNNFQNTTTTSTGVNICGGLDNGLTSSFLLDVLVIAFSVTMNTFTQVKLPGFAYLDSTYQSCVRVFVEYVRPDIGTPIKRYFRVSNEQPVRHLINEEDDNPPSMCILVFNDHFGPITIPNLELELCMSQLIAKALSSSKRDIIEGGYQLKLISPQNCSVGKPSPYPLGMITALASEPNRFDEDGILLPEILHRMKCYIIPPPSEESSITKTKGRPTIKSRTDDVNPKVAICVAIPNGYSLSAVPLITQYYCNICSQTYERSVSAIKSTNVGIGLICDSIKGCFTCNKCFRNWYRAQFQYSCTYCECDFDIDLYCHDYHDDVSNDEIDLTDETKSDKLYETLDEAIATGNDNLATTGTGGDIITTHSSGDIATGDASSNLPPIQEDEELEEGLPTIPVNSKRKRSHVATESAPVTPAQTPMITKSGRLIITPKHLQKE